MDTRSDLIDLGTASPLGELGFADRRNASESVVVDHASCERVAAFIASKPVPLDREDSSLPGFPRALVGNFYLALVAICHQTSPRGREPLEGWVDGSRRRGWDYLFARLEERARSDLSLLMPNRWSTLSTDELRSLFHDAELGERLSNPELRARLLVDLGQEMELRGWSLADQMHDACRGRIATGSPNLLATLSAFRAYNDPVRKKSVFFLSLMRNSKLWRYADDELLGPPVDYHEVRGHLRLATVQVVDRALLNKIRRGDAVTAKEDVALRSAVYDAIMRISEMSGLKNPSQAHYLFWNLFRSICTRESPQCFALHANCSLPSRYMPVATDDQGGHRCPFASFCPSAGVADPICEHVIETDYY